MRCRHVAQPGRSKVEGRLPIREGTDHAGAPPDLAQDALERVVGADAPPVLLREARSTVETGDEPQIDPINLRTAESPRRAASFCRRLRLFGLQGGDY
jgi:hypothetical protein